jgi:hypothetical protein
MVQVVLSILKPAGNVGATVQLAIAPPELLKVMSVMAKSIKAMRPLVVATLRFIQLRLPLPPLKPMGQSWRGVIQVLGAQVRPLVVAIPRFI